VVYENSSSYSAPEAPVVDPPILGNLHLIVGSNGTLDSFAPVVGGGSLPPGVALPTPIPLPNAVSVVGYTTVPPLASGQRYQTQLYLDSCHPAVLAGEFST